MLIVAITGDAPAVSRAVCRGQIRCYSLTMTDAPVQSVSAVLALPVK